MTTRWYAVELGLKLSSEQLSAATDAQDILALTREIEVVVGDSSHSGIGFGYRDMAWEFETPAERSKFTPKLLAELDRRKIPYALYNGEIKFPVSQKNYVNTYVYDYEDTSDAEAQ